MASVTIAVIAEDIRFVDFLLPAIATLADGAGVRVSIDTIEKTSGCRPERLRQLVLDARRRATLTTVGVDSGGPTHTTQALSSRQKRRVLIQKLGGDLNGAVLAIAAPCVEAWLLAEPGAFREGIEAALRLQFHMPRSASE